MTELFRVIYEVHGILAADSLKEAEEAAQKLAKQNRWIFKRAIVDDPKQDESFRYPKEVKELIEDERRWRER